MGRSQERGNRPDHIRCLNCGHRFIAMVPQKGHPVAEIQQPVKWVMSGTRSTVCPSCGSELVEEKND